MVRVKVPWEPEPLDPWKAAWDRLIWKALIPKVKAIEGELNRNPLDLSRGDLSAIPSPPPVIQYQGLHMYSGAMKYAPRIFSVGDR